MLLKKEERKLTQIFKEKAITQVNAVQYQQLSKHLKKIAAQLKTCH